MKRIFLSAALLIAAAPLTFANNKGNAKASSTETNAKNGTLYYFPISEDGTTYTSLTTSTSQNDGICQGSSLEFCSVGLTIDQVSISGSTATVNLTEAPVPPAENRDNKD